MCQGVWGMGEIGEVGVGTEATLNLRFKFSSWVFKKDIQGTEKKSPDFVPRITISIQFKCCALYWVHYTQAYIQNCEIGLLGKVVLLFFYLFFLKVVLLNMYLG